MVPKGARPRWEWLLYLLGLLVLAHMRLLRKCKPALELEIPSHYIVFANSELDKTKRFSRRPFLVASVMTAFSKSGLAAIRHLSVLSTKSVFPRFFGFCLMIRNGFTLCDPPTWWFLGFLNLCTSNWWEFQKPETSGILSPATQVAKCKPWSNRNSCRCAWDDYEHIKHLAGIEPKLLQKLGCPSLYTNIIRSYLNRYFQYMMDIHHTYLQITSNKFG